MVVKELLYQLLVEGRYCCWLQRHCSKIWRLEELTLLFAVGKGNEGMSRCLASELSCRVQLPEVCRIKATWDLNRAPLVSAMRTPKSDWDNQKSTKMHLSVNGAPRTLNTKLSAPLHMHGVDRSTLRVGACLAFQSHKAIYKPNLPLEDAFVAPWGYVEADMR